MADEELEVRARLIADAQEFLTPMQQASTAVKQLQAALMPTNKMMYAAGAAAGAAGFALYKYGKAAFETAATVAELDVAIEAVGRSTAIGANKIKEATNAIRANGITMDASQRIALTYARNNLDMAAASKVARVAQDLAVLSQKDSTQTAELLTRAIQTGSSILLKSAGISKYASEGYAVYARQLGKNATSLTAVERQQATVNLVLSEGAKVAGVYERSMTEPGKVLRSFKRLQSDIRLEFGKVLLEGFGPSIKAAYDLTAAFSKSVRDGGPFADLLKRLAQSAREMGQPFADAIGKLTLFVKGIDGGRIQADKLTKTFERLAPAVSAVGTGLATMTGAKLLALIGPFKGIASKISPVVTGLVVLTALSPRLQASFAKLVAAAKPLIPAFVAIGVAVAEMMATAAEIFTSFVSVLSNVAPLITSVAGGFTSMAGSLETLKPVLQFVAITVMGMYIKKIILASIASEGFAFRVKAMALSVKNSLMAVHFAAMRLWSNFQFGVKTGNTAMASFKATSVAALRTVGLAMKSLALAAKSLIVSLAPMIAIFAAFKLYEMFTKGAREAKERTDELTQAIKNQIYELDGATAKVVGYANGLQGIEQVLLSTGESSDKIRIAMMDLNIPFHQLVESYQALQKGGNQAIQQMAIQAGVQEDLAYAVAGYVTGANNLNTVPAQYRDIAKALKTMKDESEKVKISDLVKEQINQIRVTTKLGDKAYDLAKAELEKQGVIKGAIDTEKEYIAVNELLAKKLTELQAKEDKKKKSLEDSTKKTHLASDANKVFIANLNTLKSKTEDGKVSVDAFAEAMFGGYKDANELSGAILGMRESAAGLMEGLKNTKGNQDEFNKSGQELYKQLTENGAKLSELGGKSGDLANYYKTMIAQFTDAAIATGREKKEVDALLESLGILAALDNVTVKIDADIRLLKNQLGVAAQMLQQFEKLSGFENQARAENYARFIGMLNQQITALEASKKAAITTGDSFKKFEKSQSGANKEAEKLKKKIMEVAEKALAKAKARLNEYTEAMDNMKDATQTAIYGAYSFGDAMSKAERAVEEHNSQLASTRDELKSYSNDVAESINNTLAFSDALSGYDSVAEEITSTNKRVAEVQAEVNKEQALYEELLGKANSTQGRKARREAYEEAAKQMEKVVKAQTDLSSATADATKAQENQKSVLDRLREQYQKAVKFSGLLNNLVAKGLSREGYDQVLAMGAETGIRFAEELLGGSGEKITEVNKMFTDLSDLSKKSAEVAGKAFFKIGDDLGADFIAALASKAHEASKFTDTIKRLVALGLSPNNIRMVLEAGVEAGSKIALAIEKGGADTVRQMNQLESSLRGQAENLATLLNNTFYKTGFDLATQIVQGIEDKIEDLNEKLADMTVGELKAYLEKVQGEFDAILKGLPTKPADQTANGTTGGGTTDGGTAGAGTTGGGTSGRRSDTDLAAYAKANFSSFKEAVKAMHPEAVAKYMSDGTGLNASEMLALRAQFPRLAAVPFAAGGIVSRPTLGLVGEAGPEAVIPLNRMGAMGGQTVINLTVNAGMGTDGKSVGDAIVNELKRWSRKNGKIPVETA